MRDVIAWAIAIAVMVLITGVISMIIKAIFK